MRKPPVFRRTAVGALLASATLMSASLTAVAPAAAGQEFGPRSFGGPHTNAGNWGGYAATGHTFTSITGKWIEPKVVCRGRALYAPWLGIDGFGDETVEQTGVLTQCVDGKLRVRGWYEMYPYPAKLYSNPASMGDHFTAAVKYIGSGTYKLTLTDNTKGWTRTVIKHLTAENATAEAVIEAPGGFPSIPGGVTFTGIKVNGKLLSTFAPAKLTAAGGWTPGPLNGGTFTIKHT